VPAIKYLDRITITVLLLAVLSLWAARAQGPIDLRYDAGVNTSVIAQIDRTLSASSPEAENSQQKDGDGYPIQVFNGGHWYFLRYV